MSKSIVYKTQTNIRQNPDFRAPLLEPTCEVQVYLRVSLTYRRPPVSELA